MFLTPTVEHWLMQLTAKVDGSFWTNFKVIAEKTFGLDLLIVDTVYVHSSWFYVSLCCAVIACLRSACPEYILLYSTVSKKFPKPLIVTKVVAKYMYIYMPIRVCIWAIICPESLGGRSRQANALRRLCAYVCTYEADPVQRLFCQLNLALDGLLVMFRL